MPIIQQTNPWAGILGGLISGAGSFVANREQAKKTEQDRQDKLKQQGIANAISQGNLDVNRANAGLTKQADGSYGADPRIAGMLAGLGSPQAPAPGGGPPTASGAPPSQPPQSGPNALPPGLAGAATGAAVAATPQKPTPQQYQAQAQGELTAADKLEAQIRGFIGIPGPQAREVVTELQQEANQHRERATALFQQAGRAKTEADVDTAKALTASENAFGGKEMTSLPNDPKKALPILRKRLQAERGHGYRDLVGDTQKEITDDENRIHQDTVDAENRRQQAIMNAQRGQSLQVRIDQIGANQGGGAGYEAAARHIKGMKPADAVAYLNTIPDLSNKDYDRLVKGVTTINTIQTKRPPNVPLADKRGADFDSGVRAIQKDPNNHDTVVSQYAAKYNLTPDKASALFDEATGQ